MKGVRYHDFIHWIVMVLIDFYQISCVGPVAIF